MSNLMKSPLGKLYSEMILSIIEEAKEYSKVYTKVDISCMHGRDIHFDDGTLTIYSTDDYDMINLRTISNNNEPYYLYAESVISETGENKVKINIPITSSERWRVLKYIHDNYSGKLLQEHGNTKWYHNYIEKQINSIQEPIRKFVALMEKIWGKI